MEVSDIKEHSNGGHASTQDRLKTPRGFEVKCPSCGSERLFRDGWRRLTDGSKVQRFLCRDCGHRFTDPSHRHGKIHETLDLSKPIDYEKTEDEDLGLAGSRSETGVVTLMEKPPQTVKQPAGGTLQKEIENKLLEYAWWMKKEGYAESTIEGRVRVLRVLVKYGADLFNPESVKDAIARQKWSEGRKANAVKAYTTFLRMHNMTWQPPICREVRSLPFIPLEREIDDLIASCNIYIAAFLRILKETGARAGEVYRLKWSDVDLECKTIRIIAEKNSEPRIFKISNNLLSILEGLPKEDAYIFHHYKSLKNLRRSFNRYRKKAAFKFGNPRLLRISFHTLRHWKATMEYYKTKDILYVMRILGHKNIKNTMVYTQLVKNIEDDEYICKVARTPMEIQKLIEAGFEYVCQKDDLVFFKKRK